MTTKKADDLLVVAAIESLKALVTTAMGESARVYAELKADFNEKHQENLDKRHDLRGRVDDLGNRMVLAESILRTIVGDNTGESGLLHELKRNQEELKDGVYEAREEFRRGLAAVASDVREIKVTTASAPATRDWMNKWLGVGAAIALFCTVIGGIAALVTIAHGMEVISAHIH